MNPNSDSVDVENLTLVIVADGQPAAGGPTLIQLETRFLYPFFFEPNSVLRASDALKAATPAGKAHVWECARPLGYYQDEVLDQVIKFLFSNAGPAGCGYLRVSGEKTETWFQRTEIALKSGATLPVKLVSGPRIEVFLSNDGVGVLSIALTPDLSGLALEDALEFNYRLTQCRPSTTTAIRIPPQDLATVPPAQRVNVQQPPGPDASLGERLTQRGGAFTLIELIEALLVPLRTEPVFRFRAALPTLSVYTVAHFGADLDMGVAQVRDQMAPFLSSLAQLEESTHAGAAEVPVANALLNRRHWAAVGQLGAAHLVANQPAPVGLSDHPFNAERLPRVRDKYFIPYLMALLQRLVLHRSIETASTILRVRPRRRAHELAHLRAHLLRFAIDGHFNQVSIRESLHRFYRVSQQGLDAPTAWEEIRLAISELHAWEDEIRQHRLGRNVTKNVRHITEVQKFVHLIEYCLMSVYLAHLWHMFAEGNKKVEKWVADTFHIQREWVVSSGVVVAALLGLLLVVILNAVVKHFSHRKRRRKAPVAGAGAG